MENGCYAIQVGALAFCPPVHSSLLWSNVNCNSVLFPKWPRKQLQQVQTAACPRQSQDAELPAVFPQVCRLPASWSAWSCTWLHSARRPDTPHTTLPFLDFMESVSIVWTVTIAVPAGVSQVSPCAGEIKPCASYKARAGGKQRLRDNGFARESTGLADRGSAGTANFPRCSLAGWKAQGAGYLKSQ